VATYEVTIVESLTKELKGYLPSIEEIEAEFADESPKIEEKPQKKSKKKSIG
jgi:hypothetical protein